MEGLPPEIELFNFEIELFSFEIELFSFEIELFSFEIELFMSKLNNSISGTRIMARRALERDFFTFEITLLTIRASWRSNICPISPETDPPHYSMNGTS